LARPEHRIGEDDEASEYGDEGNFGRLTLGDEPFVKGLQHRIVSAGGDGRHVEDTAHGRSTAVDSRRGIHDAALPDEGSDPDKGRRSLVIDPAKFRDRGKQR
jgi:hypothetical protein